MGSTHLFILLMLLNWLIAFALGWVYGGVRIRRRTGPPGDLSNQSDEAHWQAGTAQQCESLERMLQQDIAGHSDVLKEFQRWLESRASELNGGVVEGWTREVERVRRANRRVMTSLDLAADLLSQLLGHYAHILADQRQSMGEYRDKTEELSATLDGVPRPPLAAGQIAFLSASVLDLQKDNEALQAELDVCRENLMARMALTDTMGTETRQDGLTQLPNHVALEERLCELQSSLNDGRERFAAIIFDVDDFQGVVARYGHAVGDAVLAMLGRVFREDQRSGQFVARWEDDRFVFLLENAGLEQAQSTAERQREKVEGVSLRFAENQVKVTLSGGIAEAVAGDSNSTVLANAIEALRHAKAEGGNRICRHGQLSLTGSGEVSCH